MWELDKRRMLIVTGMNHGGNTLMTHMFRWSLLFLNYIYDFLLHVQTFIRDFSLTYKYTRTYIKQTYISCLQDKHSSW